ncbi:MAG: argininosuccinate lyase [Spirochaetales bacterium]
MAKIWEKGYSLDAVIEEFTVGDDHLLDRRLVAADAVGSIAHARMLREIGLLSDEQAQSIERELREIARRALSSGVTIERSQEDSHTAIEELLTDSLGETGKRIHVGRSRNDQVQASTRLFAREGALAVRRALLNVADELLLFARKDESTPMVGRTHLQPAMPSTVGLWAESYAEMLLDADVMLAAAFGLVNRSPLGAAAGYGVPLPLDRSLVADSLGFDGVHHNVIAAVGSRGQVELALLDACDQVGIVLSRLATDLILFSMPEFGYFSLPPELCSGSSIMPQKRNPDGLELLRGKSGVLSSYADRLRGIVRSLPSGYNRDVQETKEPLMRGLDLTLSMLRVASLTMRSVSVNRERLLAAFEPGVLATDRAIERVAAGESFRDAYRAVAEELAGGERAGDGLSAESLAALIQKRVAVGSPGNLDLDAVESSIERARTDIDGRALKIEQAVAGLLGEPASLYPGTPSER